MNRKATVPTRYDFDFSDSEDDEEEVLMTPISSTPLPHHHHTEVAIVPEAATDAQTVTPPLDHSSSTTPTTWTITRRRAYFPTSPWFFIIVAGNDEEFVLAQDEKKSGLIIKKISFSDFKHQLWTWRDQRLVNYASSQAIGISDSSLTMVSASEGCAWNLNATGHIYIEEEADQNLFFFGYAGNELQRNSAAHLVSPKEQPFNYTLIQWRFSTPIFGKRASSTPATSTTDDINGTDIAVSIEQHATIDAVEAVEIEYAPEPHHDHDPSVADEKDNVDLLITIENKHYPVVEKVESVVKSSDEVEVIHNVESKTYEVVATPRIDTVGEDRYGNKKKHRYRRHPHLRAIADRVSSTLDAIATGIGIKRHRQKIPNTLANDPSSTASLPLPTPTPVEPPRFGIVLVNIKRAAEERYIHCEKKWLDEDPPYVALSYRWGELDEQIIPATKDYYARIVSFHIDDFFKLCQAMLHEPDLQDIEYVWVDAICVDQENMEARKATIYRMNDIYIHAAAIVAVPDLHAYHIATTTTANSAAMDTIEHYRRYLYYLLVGSSEAQQTLVEMDNAWMDKLGVPTSDALRRDLILNTITNTATATTTMTTTTKHRSRGITSQLFTQQLMTLMADPRGVMASAADSLKVKDDDHQDQDQQLSSRMMMEFQRFDWQQQLDQRQTDILQSVQFLQSIMEDWSDRTWVISEYHIAKRKTGKLKFWYNQLSSPELNGQRFFEFEFKKQKRQPRQDGNINASSLQHDQQPHPYTKQIIELTSHFDASMRQRLTKRSVLEMMLQTKASKVEDRFHAIIPLASKYKRYIKDRHSISQLGVSDMLSVRLKLMEWTDTKDRLMLLFSEHQPTPSVMPFLPTFATHFKAIQPGLAKLLTRYPSQCNFDVNSTQEDEEENEQGNNGDDDDNAQGDNNGGGDGHVRLVRTGGLDELWLCPRMYCERQAKLHGKSSFHNLWHDLGIDPTKDQLDAVSIPLFIDIDEMKEEKKNSLVTLDLQLLGSWEKNIWIMYPFDASVKETNMCSMESQKEKLPKGFRVY